MTRTSVVAVVFLAVVVGPACERRADVPPAQPMEGAGGGVGQPLTPQQGVAPGAGVDTVTVDMLDRKGMPIGAVRLTHHDEGVHIAARVSGLEPGEHGFHVHENAACDPPSFESAGGHFAPGDRQHGLRNPQGPHAGDLPNLRARDDRVADTTFVAPNLSLRGGDGSLVGVGGAALVVHSGPDDYRTDPSGDSGERVACGVIEIE